MCVCFVKKNKCIRINTIYQTFYIMQQCALVCFLLLLFFVCLFFVVVVVVFFVFFFLVKKKRKNKCIRINTVYQTLYMMQQCGVCF